MRWGSFSIRVNAVAPGFIDTRLTQVRREGENVGIPEKAREAVVNAVGRTTLPGMTGKAEHIADAILFLGSDLSKYITGQVLVVDGGLTNGVV